MNIGEIRNVNDRLTGSIATRTIDLPRIGLRKVESMNPRASSASTASQIAAQDFLRERALEARERYLPQGPVVVFSGPAQWHDWELLWLRLDEIHARVPHMTLVTTGQRKGADAIAAAWAARSETRVPVVAFGLYGTGRKTAFMQRASFMPRQGVRGRRRKRRWCPRSAPRRLSREPIISLRAASAA